MGTDGAEWGTAQRGNNNASARARTALSEALSELSRLSSYRPAAAAPAAPAPLTKRTPSAEPALPEPIGEPEPAQVPRQRSAEEIRKMLSGYQAGVNRGRAAPQPDDSPRPSQAIGPTDRRISP